MTPTSGVEVLPIRGIPEVRAGDDLAALILDAAQGPATLRDGDVVVVTQKVVSKAEGRVVQVGPEGKAGWVARETRRVVARRGDLVIAETHHGFVCANAGVDASNVAEGFVSLLPEDPDASAERILTELTARTGALLAVVVTDTFGRAWRRGLVNVAIGCAGLPALVDLRGTTDAFGMVLEATVVALADEIAAASGLVVGKADGTAAAIVRGVRLPEDATPPQPATALVRPPEEDLFRVSPLSAVQGRGGVAMTEAREVPPECVIEALRAAGAADRDGRWVFVVVRSAAARERLVAALPDPPAGRPAVLAVPCLPLAAGDDRTGDGPEARLGAGGAIRAFVLAIAAQGLTARWRALEGLRHAPDVRAALGLADTWVPLGVVEVGASASAEERSGRSDAPLDVSERSMFL